ncbi:MAG TPA: hypothetical protein VK997_05630, partial [Deferrisomatales bacterium]|nr:hypothetical protein [Deferrisomatales bacterium]
MFQSQSQASPAVAPPVSVYRGLPGVFDEMCDASGAVREHWRYLLGTWDSLGPEEIAGRARELRRLLQENGVTYNPL